MSRIYEDGTDSYGDFELGQAKCSVCGVEDVICVSYDATPKLPEYKGTPINPAKLLIGELHLCIGRGCYAKAHRQVAHMVTENKYRSSE